MNLLIHVRRIAAAVAIVGASIASVASLDEAEESVEVEGKDFPPPFELADGASEARFAIHVDAADGADVALRVDLAATFIPTATGDAPKLEATLTAKNPGDAGTITSDAGTADQGASDADGGLHLEVAAACSPAHPGACEDDFVLVVREVDPDPSRRVLVSWTAIGSTTGPWSTPVKVTVKP